MSRPANADRFFVLLVAGFAALALVLVALATGPDEREEKAHAGSTHVASADGTRALYEYLSRAGFHPGTVETADLAVPDGAALVVVAAGLSEGEASALAERVKSGLHLLLATDQAADPAFEALGMSVDADGGAGHAVAAWPSAMTRGVERVEVVSPLRAQPAAGWVELFADDAGAVASAKSLGAGEVVVLLDPAALTNDGLPRAGNLRFADAVLRRLAGPGGVVIFDEYHHGFGAERTIAGWFSRAGLLPALWLLALVFGADALRRYGTRVGPPRPAPQPERRAIREFIAGHAGLLRAAGHRAWAARALERSLRRRLHDELGVPLSTPPPEVFRRLAQRAPPSAARAYRALEHAAGADADMTEKELLDLARDVRLAERSLSTVRRRSR
ncbi:MAG TPA: DUF4350 domain-containing protein [bacterium]|nr:DUF4350 domain-containing protein [bacterium]